MVEWQPSMQNLRQDGLGDKERLLIELLELRKSLDPQAQDGSKNVNGQT